MVADVTWKIANLLHPVTRFSEVSLRGDGRLRGKLMHPGSLALHVAVDDHSRLAFTTLMTDQKKLTTITFLEQAREFYAQHGVVRALLTDNGANYRSREFSDPGPRHHYSNP